MKGQKLSPCPSWHLCPRRLGGVGAVQSGPLQSWSALCHAFGVGSRLWVSLNWSSPRGWPWTWMKRLFLREVCVWLDAFYPPVLCQQSGLHISQPVSDETSLLYLKQFFNCLNLSRLILTEMDEGLFRRVVGALAEGQLRGTVLNFSYCSQSNHPCTILADSKTCGKEQLAVHRAEGCLLPSSPQCLAVVSWACSDTLKALAFSSWACPKILKGSALNFGPCLQCRENRCRGFSRTCEDLLWRGWSESFSENLHVHYVDYYYFFMCSAFGSH